MELFLEWGMKKGQIDHLLHSKSFDLWIDEKYA